MKNKKNKKADNGMQVIPNPTEQLLPDAVNNGVGSAVQNELSLAGGLQMLGGMEAAKQAKKKNILKTVGTIAGGVIGTALLPGVGTALGAQLGGMAGGAISRADDGGKIKMRSYENGGVPFGMYPMPEPIPVTDPTYQLAGLAPRAPIVEPTSGSGFDWKGLGSTALNAIKNVNLPIGDVVTSGIVAANALTKEKHNKNKVHNQQAYNPYPMGTGSKSLYDNGGKTGPNVFTDLSDEEAAYYYMNEIPLPTNNTGYTTSTKKKGGMTVTEEIPTQYDSFDNQILPTSISSPVFAPTEDPGIPKRVEYETTYDMFGGSAQLSPIFTGFNQREASNFINEQPFDINGTPTLGSPELYSEMYQGFQPGSTSSEWTSYNYGGKVSGSKMNCDNGGMVEFNGPSHEEGGIPLNYGGKEIEVEGGETAFVDNQEDLVILGNMKVPGQKVKFKTAGKRIADKEEEADKQSITGLNLINKSNPYNKFEVFGYNAGIVKEDAATQTQQKLSAEKEALSAIQSAMLEAAKASNKKPQEFSKMFKNGGRIVADDGDKIKSIINALGKIESTDNYTVGNDSSSAFGRYQFTTGTLKGYYNQTPELKNSYSSFSEFEKAFKKSPQVQDNVMDIHTNVLLDKFGNDPDKVALAHRVGEGRAKQLFDKGFYIDDKGRKVTMDTPIGSSQKPTDKETPAQYLNKFKRARGSYITNNQGNPTPAYGDVTIQGSVAEPVPVPVQQRERSEMQRMPTRGDIERYNSVIGTPPVIETIPSNRIQNPVSTDSRTKKTSLADRNRLPITSMLPEIADIFDKPSFVQGQQYDPQMYIPYQVSMQDKLNENQATFRAISQAAGANPSALSVLAGQKYSADNAVLGEQFRINQGIENEVINKNTALLNDAELKNIQLADQQYERQAQANSNTSARKRQALASISDKVNQNRVQNMGIRLAENMFDFRPDANYNLNYQGEDNVFVPQSGQVDSQNKNVTKKYDANGNLVYTREQMDNMTKQQIEQQNLINKRRAAMQNTTNWLGII